MGQVVISYEKELDGAIADLASHPYAPTARRLAALLEASRDSMAVSQFILRGKEPRMSPSSRAVVAR